MASLPPAPWSAGSPVLPRHRGTIFSALGHRMAQTPLTSASSYATTTDMVNRYDVRTLGQLLNDDDSRGALSNSEVLASTKLIALLKESSGEFESACVAGARYSPTDIAAVITNDGVAKEFVAGLICALTVGRLTDRRLDRMEPPPPAVVARQMLELLRQGQRIIPTTESSQAGKEVPVIDATTAQLRSGKTLVVTEARRYFGPLHRFNNT